MKKIKVIIGSTTVKDDYNPSTDPKKLLSLEIDEELDDIIPSLEMELERDTDSLVELTQGMIVQVYKGEIIKRVFYGPIMDIKKDNRTIKVQANMETIELLRKKVNQLYRYFGESE
jgi:hypothetical protein